jgi:hypothetical protein
MVDVAEGNLAQRRRAVDIAARNARTNEGRLAVYRAAFEERVRAGQFDEAMEYYKLMNPETKTDRKTAPSTGGSGWTVKPVGN